MRKRPTAQGQAATEFVILAPILFLFFFCVIQMAYTAYVALAVQRSALAAARQTTLSPRESPAFFKTQLALSLLPIVKLTPKTLFTIFGSQYRSEISEDKKQVTVQVRYPMPIWIPIVRNIFGETLEPSFHNTHSPEDQAFQAILSQLHLTGSNTDIPGDRLPIRWMTFEEKTFNEAYRAP